MEQLQNSLPILSSVIFVLLLTEVVLLEDIRPFVICDFSEMDFIPFCLKMPSSFDKICITQSSLCDDKIFKLLLPTNEVVAR